MSSQLILSPGTIFRALFKNYSASLNMDQVQQSLTQATVILMTSPQLLIFLDSSES